MTGFKNITVNPVQAKTTRTIITWLTLFNFQRDWSFSIQVGVANTIIL